MKRSLALALAAAALCAPAAQATTQKSPTMAQFNALKAQLAKDEKTIKSLQTLANATIGVMLCLNANNADALQGTWQAVDTLAVSLGKPAVFGAQATVVNDANACSDFQVARSHAIPPTISPFSSLAALLTG